MQIALIIVFLFCVLLMQLYYWGCSRSLRIREIYQKKFSCEVDQFLEKETSDENLKIIGFLVDTIDKDKMVTFLLVALLQLVDDRFKGRIRKSNNQFSPELANSVVYWMYSLSYRKPFKGLLIRHCMSVLNDPKVRAQWERKIKERAINCTHSVEMGLCAPT